MFFLDSVCGGDGNEDQGKPSSLFPRLAEVWTRCSCFVFSAFSCSLESKGEHEGFFVCVLKHSLQNWDVFQHCVKSLGAQVQIPLLLIQQAFRFSSRMHSVCPCLSGWLCCIFELLQVFFSIGCHAALALDSCPISVSLLLSLGPRGRVGEPSLGSCHTLFTP